MSDNSERPEVKRDSDGNWVGLDDDIPVVFRTRHNGTYDIEEWERAIAFCEEVLEKMEDEAHSDARVLWNLIKEESWYPWDSLTTGSKDKIRAAIRSGLVTVNREANHD